MHTGEAKVKNYSVCAGNNKRLAPCCTDNGLMGRAAAA